jgi:hypothetical protein
MPNWLLPLNSILERIDSKMRILGHKFLHYRSWFARELAPYVKSVLSDSRIRRALFWDLSFLEGVARDHIRGLGNYVLELNAVLTLEAVERLLLPDAGTARRRPGSGNVLTSVTSTDG